MVMRGGKRKGVRYFGPVRPRLRHPRHARPPAAHVPAAHVLATHKFEPPRALRAAVPAVPHREVLGSVRRRDRARRRTTQLVEDLLEFLDGETDAVVQRLDGEMQAAAERAGVRAGGPAARPAQPASEGDREAADGRRPQRGPRRDRRRRGRARGRGAGVLRAQGPGASAARASCSTRSRTSTAGELIDTRPRGPLRRARRTGVPKPVLVPAEPEDIDLYEEWLSQQRGSQVADPGARSAATSDAARDRRPATPARSSSATACAGRATTTAGRKALNELQDHLGLPERPAAHRVLRHEPHPGQRLRRLDGGARGRPAEEVASTARFKIKSGQGNDDFAAMEEVLTRRLTAYLAEREAAASSGAAGKFAYPPQLLLVDGGKGQLSVAVRVLEELGLADEIPVAVAREAVRGGLRARAGRPDPPPAAVRGARTLLQRIRDEAHRFAITYHRELRDKRMTKSVLDDIAGLGDVRKKRLVKELGGVKAVDRRRARASSASSVAAGPGRGRPRPRQDPRGPLPAGEPCRRACSASLGDAGVAKWWQDGFTARRRPRVRRQMLPLAIRTHLAGAADVLDIGCGDGPGDAPRRRRCGATRWRSGSTRRPRRSRWPRSAAAERSTRRAGAAGLPFRDGAVRRRGGVPRVRAHRRRRRGDRRGGPGCSRPGGRFLFFLNHPLLADPEQRVDRRSDPRPARAVLAHRAAT